MLLLPSDALAALPVHAILFSLKSPFLRSLLRSLNELNGKDVILSLPFNSSCLEKLLELLVKGQLVANTREQVVEVKEAAEVLGFSLSNCDVLTLPSKIRNFIKIEQGTHEVT